MDLFRDIPPQTVTGLLGDPAHDPALEQGKAGADEIEHQQQPQNAADPAEVNASSSLYLGHQAGKNLCGGLGEHLWPHNIEYGGTHGEDPHQGQLELEGTHMRQQFFDGAFEIFGLFTGHPRSPVAHRPPGTRRGMTLTHAPAPPNSASESWLLAIS